MNRKRLRQVICGSAVLIMLGCGLYSQAVGDGGLVSRLWDRRPRLSQSRWNPKNWFRSREQSAVSSADEDAKLKPVVSVRPELVRNPFQTATAPLVESSIPASEPAARHTEPTAGSHSGTSTAARATDATEAESFQDSSRNDSGRDSRVIPRATANAGPATVAETAAPAESGEVLSGAAASKPKLPEIVPARSTDRSTARADVPAPRFTSIFKRPTDEMLERARRRRSGKAASAAAAPDTSAGQSDSATWNRPAAQDDPAATGDAIAAGDGHATQDAPDFAVAGAPVVAQAQSDRQSVVRPRRTLLRMPKPAPKPSPVRVQKTRTVTESRPGRVSLGTLADDAPATGTNKGFIRLNEIGSDRPDGSGRGAAASPSGTVVSAPRAGETPFERGFDSAYERLLAQVKAAANGSGSADAGTSAATAPRLPDSLQVSPFVPGTPFAATESPVSGRRRFDLASPAETDPGSASGTQDSSAADQAEAFRSENAAPSDALTRSIDEMIARSRAGMNSTFLARQARQERNTAAASANSDTLSGPLTSQVTVSQTGAVSTGDAPPLMVPGGFDAGRFRTYGDAYEEAGRGITPQRPATADHEDRVSRANPVPSESSGRVSVPVSRLAASSNRLSRAEQTERSAQPPPPGPAIIPGRPGSGVILNGAPYSVVRPRVTSNTGRALSVPDTATFRRLSYERRADELAGQVDRLAREEPPVPILSEPGASLPLAARSTAPARRFPESPSRAADASAGPPAGATAGSPIDWPDEEDLAPVQPEPGGTSWGLIVFCLALLTAGGHIAVSRFRQSRAADSAGRS